MDSRGCIIPWSLLGTSTVKMPTVLYFYEKGSVYAVDFYGTTFDGYIWINRI